ncbi:serine hydrolase [Hujiaoplasma nucleasis]|uniref:Serine hydrolase n=1 Tax=Hujiaoplasma nucleasis TaxID=2725268 RepID=A0A7L6N2F6_9MOLU|nr:serine hydrolase [Hujiaoplasma nucleasis]QLY40456.1 serine hydrolase [Hujiaoplasma nucleasis]
MKINKDEIINSMKENNFSGVISIKENNKTILQQAMGYRDRVNKLKNNMDTLFGIASGTKTFTALGILKLAEEGKLNLDDQAFKYIPEIFDTYDSSITIKHLLTHTSGIPDYLDEEVDTIHIDIPTYELLKPTDYLKIMPHTSMKFKPGEKFNYNNSAYIFLSMIIEELTGNYHKYIGEKILKKAKMKHSGFFRMDDLPHNTALGYIEKDKNNRTNIFSLPIIGGGDGGMFTTVNDIHNFWNALINGVIIKKETFNQMIKPHAKANELYYGYGQWLKPYKDLFIPIMIGEDIGVSFESGYNLEDNTSYTVIANNQHDVWPISKIMLK